MQFKAEIMDESAVERSLLRITHEIIERNHGTDGVVLLGIKRRGVPLAKKIAENIKNLRESMSPSDILILPFTATIFRANRDAKCI